MRAHGFGVAVLALSATLAITASPASAQSQRWSAFTGANGQVAAADCTDCGDDIGMILSCEGLGTDAMTMVPFAAAEQEPQGGVAPISIALDGVEYTYQATTVFQGMSGYVPLFYIPPTDPIIFTMQSAGSAVVRFEGRETRIGLRGSRAALDTFRAECGWIQSAEADAGTGVGILSFGGDEGDDSGPAPDQGSLGFGVDAPDSSLWFNAEYEDGGMRVFLLNYGVPESDNVLFSASCVQSSSITTASVSLMLDYGNAQAGEAVGAFIQTGRDSFDFPATVFAEEQFSGVSFDVDRSTPLWGALRDSDMVIMGTGANQTSAATGGGAADAVDAFLAACPGSVAAVSPQVITPDVAVSSAPAAGALFSCEDGSDFVASVSGAAPSRQLSLQVAGADLTLPEVTAAFGDKFSDGATTVQMNGATAQLTTNGNRLLCASQ